MTDVAELGFRADSSSLRTAATDLDRVSGAARRTENASARMERQIQAGFRALQGAFAALGVGAAVRQIIAIDDAYAQVEGRLRLVTTGTENLARIQEELFGIAQRTGVAYEETANLYAKVAKNAEALGLSQQQLLDFTEVTNQAIQVSGASAIEAAGGVRQLGQALASGALRGDEFNSLAENMPRLRDAIADGLGISIGELRKFAAEGKLTAEVVTQALLSQSEVIEREFQALPVTVGRAMTELENEVKRAIAEADTQPLVDAIRELQETLSDPTVIAGIANIAGGLVTLAKWSAEAATGISNLTTNVGEYAAQLSGGGSVVTDTERFIKLLEQMRDRSGLQNAAMSFFPGAVDVRYLTASNDELEREIRLQRQALGQLEEFGVSARENGAQIAEMRSEVLTLQRAIAERRGWHLPTDELEAQLDSVLRSIESLETKARDLSLDSIATAVAGPMAEIDRIVDGITRNVQIVDGINVGHLFEGLDEGTFYLQQAANGFGEVGENAGIVARKTKIATDETEKLTAAEQKAIDKLRERISIEQRVYELVQDGRDIEDARFVAAYEAANELERRLLVWEKAVEGQEEAAEAALDAEEELAKKAKETTDEIIRQQQLRAEQIQRAYERIAGGVEEVFRDLYRSIFDGFDSFTDSLKRTFENLLVELALIATRNSIIIPVVTSIGSSLGLPGLGGLTDALSLGGPLGSMFGAGGGAQFGAAAIDALGQGIWELGGMLGSATLDGIGVAIQSNAGALAGLLPAVAGVGALYGAGSGLAVPNSNVSPGLQGLGAVLAPAFSLPATILDSITGGGLFGTRWQTVGQELAFTIQDQIADATLMTMRERERSLWRGTQRRTVEDPASDLDRQLSESFGMLYDSIASGAERIGYAVGDFSFQFRESIAGLSEEEVGQVINSALSEATEALIRDTIPGIDRFRAAGEELTQTFQRLVGGVTVVQDAIDMFGLDTTVRQSMNEAAAGLQRIFIILPGTAEEMRAAYDRLNPVVQASNALILEAAAALTELAGGAQQLQANIANFWDDFASDEQQAARTAELARDLFADLGIKMPRTREDVFELVQGLDIFSESGREAFNAITASSDLLDAYFDNLERGASEAAQQAAAITNERLGLEAQLAVALGDTAMAERVMAEQAALQRAALDESNRALFDQVRAATAAAQAEQMLAAERQRIMDLQIRLLTAQGNDSGALALTRQRELEQAATDSERALLQQIYAAEDQAAAARAAAAAAASAASSTRDFSSAIRDAGNAAAEERERLETELLQLVGAEAELRARERAEIAASNRSLYDQINALRDQRAAVDETVRTYTDLANSIGSFGDSINLAANDAFGLSLGAARAEFADVSRRARLGDLDALQSFTAAGEQLRQISEAQASSRVEYFRDLAMLRNEAELAEGTALRQADLAEASFDELARQTLLLAGIHGELEILRGVPPAQVSTPTLNVNPVAAPVVITAPQSSAASRSSAQTDPETQRILADIRRLLQQLYDNSEEGMQTGFAVRAFETSGLLIREAA